MNKLWFLMFSTVAWGGILSAQDISAAFPFTSKFQEVGDGKLHYVEQGTGDPILFLHGVPMSAYGWRNVIPELTQTGRCIAVDFMGFGKSDKPEIDYTFTDQIQYLEAFIEALELTNITFVMTDVGGVIGTNYALKHPDKIKGLVFMETPLGDAETFHKNGGMMQHMLFWMGGKKKMGYKMFVKRNMFLKMMPMLIKRKLTKKEKAVYAQPFLEEKSRLAMYQLVKAFPKKGKNVEVGDMADYMNKNNKMLLQPDIPKLVLQAKPGMLINKKALKWATENLPNVSTKYVGKAKHLMEEDVPQAIGKAIKSWYLNL